MSPERKEILGRVAKRLAEMRKDWAWLIEELNESPQTANHWRHHRGIPSGKHAAVAEKLGWTVDQLLGQASGAESAWPFEKIPQHRLEKLTPGQRMQVEGVLMDKLDEIEGIQEKYRQAATEPSRRDPRSGRNRKVAP